MTPRFTLGISATLFVLSGVLSFTAAANAGGVNVSKITRGNVSFSQDGNNLIVRASNGSIIEYNRFSIEAGQIMQFILPGANSRVLNRVTGAELSRIDGTLLSNGIVYLINPQGIRIGNGALINVGGFYAAAGAMSDNDFIRGSNTFTNLSGKVTNEGTIQAQSVALVGQYVANRGTINVDDGMVAMAAGDTVYLQNGSAPIMVTVSRSAMGADGSGAGTEAAVSNTGTINAGKGKVAMASGDFYALAMDLSGTIIGKSIEARGGAGNTPGNGGVVAVNGTLDASSSTDKGGTIDLFGDRVGLMSGALVNANGATGGGNVRIGGDYLGSNAENAPQAKATYIDSNARVMANATQSGDGGRVIVWSNEYTGFFGSIEASAVGSGNGGFVETSSHDNLQAFGSVDASSALGQAGTWLLDPSNVTITNSADAGGSFNNSSPNVFTPNSATATVNVATINSSLDLGTSVTINTGSVGDLLGGAGNITLAAAITKTAGGDATLTLNAVGSITLNASIASTVGALSVALNAGTTVAMNSTVTTNGGSVSVNARGGIVIAGNITAGGTGEINITGNTAPSGSLSAVGVTVNSGVTIQTTNGTLNITGTSGQIGYSTANTGVINLGTITSGGGNVFVTGTREVFQIQGGNVFGVYNNGGTITSGGAGNVTVTGTGGSSLGGGLNYGLYNNGGTITSGGAGSVTVTGTGGSSASNDFGGNYGVYNNGGTITSGGGAVRVEGTSGTGGSNNEAILINSGSITAPVNLTLIANGGALIQAGGTISVVGTTTITAGANDATLAQSTNNFGGAVSVVSARNVSLADANALTLGASTVANNFTATAGGGIVVAGNITAGGTGAINITGNTLGSSSDGVAVNDNVTIKTTNGDLNITGTGGVNVAGNNYGFYNIGTITSGGGNVTVTGTGGSGGSYNYGVYTLDTITSGGAGSVTVTGFGGSGGGLNSGVYNTGTITSGGLGSVTVTGTGGSGVSGSGSSLNRGVYNGYFATITSGGGNVTVTGTGGIGAGGYNYGVYTIQSTITSGAAGSVTVTGTGGSGDVGNNYGVYSYNGTITSGGAGSVTVTGAGGSGDSGDNYGVYNSGPMTSGGGGVFVTGTGGTGGINNEAIYINDSRGSITAPASLTLTSLGGDINQTNATISVVGTTSITAGANNVTLAQATNNFGGAVIVVSANNVSLADANALTIGASTVANDFTATAGGGVVIAGNVTAGGTGEINITGNTNVVVADRSKVGVLVNGGVTIQTTDGDLNITGTGGSDVGGFNVGVTNDGIIQASGAGNVTVTGTGGSNAGLNGFNSGLYLEGTIASVGGNVTVTGQGGSGGSGNDAIVMDAGAIGALGNLTLNSLGGAINQYFGTIAVGGTTTITAGANDVTLAQSNNDFGGAVSVVSANNVSLADANALTLGASNISGNLAVTAAVAINQTSGAIQVDGATTLTASAAGMDISLAGGANNFAGTVTIGGTASNVRDFGLRNINAAAGVVVNLSNATNLRDFTIMYDNAGYTVPELTMASLRNVNITTGAGVVIAGNVTAGNNGEINITGNTNADTSLRSTVGVTVNLDKTIQTTNGDLNITGTGGVDAGGNNYGVLNSGGIIQAGGIGNVVVTGTGGDGAGGYNYGVYNKRDFNSDGTIVRDGIIKSIGTGNVTVTGTGGNGNGGYNAGVKNSFSQILSDGSGAVTVIGFGGSDFGWNYGVENYIGTITSGGAGSVTVTGTGGSGDSGVNHGLSNSSFSSINSGNGGNVFVTGTGGSGGSFNYGIVNQNQITSGGAGNMTVTGFGGSGDGGKNYGVYNGLGGTITSGGAGYVTVTGTGGIGGSLNHGVYNQNLITSGGAGNVTVTGTGGSGDDGSNYGVYMTDASDITSGGTGSVTVTGTGGTSLSAGLSDPNYGIFIIGASTITSGGVGSVTVTGTGGDGVNGNNDGVFNRYSTITSGGGDVTVIGNGGTNVGVTVSGGSNDGVNNYYGTITSGGSGNVTVTGTGGTGGSDNEAIVMNGGSITAPVNLTLNSNGGAINQVGGMFSVVGTTTITAGANDVTLAQATNNFGGSVIVVSANNVSLADANALTIGASTVGNNFTAMAGGGVVIAGNVTAGGTGAINITGNTLVLSSVGVTVNGGVTIQATDGNLNITGTGGSIAIYSPSYGVYNLGTITSGGTGSVTVMGTGGAYGSAIDGYDTGIYNRGTITSGGGDVTVTGMGGGGLGFNYGIYNTAGGTITSGGAGNVIVTGTGGSSWSVNYGKNYGVYNLYSTITSGGSGSVTVTGNGGNSDYGFNYGIQNTNSTISSGGAGSVTVTGNGGSGGGSNRGISTDYGTITSGGGDVTVMGTGGSGGGNYNDGVYNYRGTITSAFTGSVTVTGNGGNSAGDSNIGVYNSSGTITSGGAGSVTVTGTGGDGASGYNYGVYNYLNIITSGGGDVFVTGTGGNGARGENFGVNNDNGTITSGGTGSVTVTGTGGDGTDGYNYGVYNFGTIETSGAGSVTVTGTGGSGGGNYNYGVFNDYYDGITSGGGDVFVTGTGGIGGSNNWAIKAVGDITAPVNLTLTSLGGAIIQTNGTISVVGTTTITAGASLTFFDVTLEQATNDFGGAVTIVSGRDVTLRDSGAISFAGVSTISGNLVVTVNDFEISDGAAGTLSVAGTTTLNAGSLGDITLDNANDFGGAVSVVSARNVSLADANVLVLGSSTVENNFTATAGGSIVVPNFIVITARGTGAINITGNTNLLSSVGVDIRSVSTIQTTNGNLTITGTGGSGGGSSYGITSFGTITSLGTGSVTVVGQGGSGGSYNFGIFNYFGTITSGGGNVTVTGTGGSGDGVNYGIRNSQATITSGGSGSVTVTGNGGTGGGSNWGVYNTDASTITSGGSGGVTVTGNGGSGGGSNWGVVNIYSSTITSVGGSVTVAGTNGSGGDSFAVQLSDDSLLSAPGALILISNGGAIIQTSGTISVVGTTTITAGANDVTLAQATNNFGGTVSVVSANNVSLADANALTIGASTVANNFTATAMDSLFIAGNVTAGGIVTLNADTGTLVITTDGDITAGGVVNLTGASGILTAGNVTTTNDDVNFNSATTLTGDILVSTDTGAGNITFSSTLDGTLANNQSLGLTAGIGNINFNGTVGVTRLNNVTITSAANVNAGNGLAQLAFNANTLTLTTITNTATFTGALTLTGLNTNAASWASVNNFSSTGEGGTITNLVTFGNNGYLTLGGALLFQTFTNGLDTTGVDGAVTMNGTFTSGAGGNQNYGNLILGSDVSHVSSGSINYNGTIDATSNGAQTLTSNASVNVLFTGLVGNDNALGGLDVTAGGTIQLNSASVNTASDSSAGTDGDQSYRGDVVLGNTTVGFGGSTLTATGGISFLGKVDALESGKQTLTADAIGVGFAGNVGSTAELGELTVTAAGFIAFGLPISVAPITIDTLASDLASTTGNQTYNGGVILFQDATLTSSIGGDITFASTIDALELGKQTLIVDAFDDVIFDGNIGAGTFALGELTVTAGGTINLNSAIVNTASDNVAGTSGAQLFNSAAVLGNASGSTLTSIGGGDITFISTLNGAKNLTLNAGAGTVTFGSTVGNAAQLLSLNIASAGEISIGAAIRVNGPVSITSNVGTAVTLGAVGGGLNLTNVDLNQITSSGALNITANGAAMTVNGVNGGGAITGTTTLTAGDTGVTFSGGSSTFDNALTVSSAAVLSDTSIGAGGEINFNATVTLQPGLAQIVSDNADINFAGPIVVSTSVNTINLILNSVTGDIHFNGDLGSAAGTFDLDISASTGTVAFAGQVDLIGRSVIVRSANNVTTSAATDFSTGSLVLNNVSGTASFEGALLLSTLTVANTVNNFSSTGMTGTIQNAVVFENTGTLTLGHSGGTQEFVAGFDSGIARATATTLNGTFNTGVGGIVTLGAAVLGSDTAFNTNALLRIGTVDGTISKFDLDIATSGLTLAGAVNNLGTLSITNIDSSANITLLATGGLTISESSWGNIGTSVDQVILGNRANFTGNVQIGDPSIEPETWVINNAVIVDFKLNGGGKFIQDADIIGTGSLTIHGSGTTIEIGGNSTLASFNYDDSILVKGAATRTLTATGAGGITFNTTGKPAGISANTSTSNLVLITTDAGAPINITGTFTTAGGFALNNLTVGGNGVDANTGTIALATSGAINGAFIAHNANAIQLSSSDLDGSGTSWTAGSFDFANATTLSAATDLRTTGGGIEFGSTLNGTHSLGLTTGAGDIAFVGAVGSGLGTELGAVTINAANNVSMAAFTAASLNQTVAGTGIFQNNGILTATTGGVTIDSSIVDINANIVASGAGQAVLVTGTTNLGGNVTTNDGDVTFASATTLSGVARTINTNVGVSVGTGNILFSSTLTGTLAGAQALTLTSGTGNITFREIVGAVALGDVTINAANDVTMALAFTAASLNQAVAGTGTFQNNRVLTATTGGVTINSALVDINANIVASTSAQAVLVTGTTDLGADVTTNNGNVTFASATTLSGDRLINTDGAGAGAGNITFSSTLDATLAGAQNLGLTAGAGDINFNGTVGVTRLNNVTVTSAANVNAGSGGAQLAFNANTLTLTTITDTATFTGALTLTGLNTNAASWASVNNFSSTGEGGTITNLVTFANTGSLTLGQAGGTQTFASGLDTTGVDGAVTMNGRFTSGAGGNQNYGDLLLGSAVSHVSSGSINYNGTIDATSNGAQTLRSNASVNVLFTGLVGSDKALGGLDVIVGGTIQLNSAIVNTASDSVAGTNGNQGYNGDVVLGNTTVGVGGSTLTATGGRINFSETVDALESGKQTLTVDAAGVVGFAGNVGSTRKLGELTVTAADRIFIGEFAPITIDTLASVAAGTTGNQTYNGGVNLFQDATLTSSIGGDITFASTIDANQLGTQTLTVDAFDDVIFDGNIGAAGAGAGGFPTALGALFVTAQTGTIQLNSEGVITASDNGAGTDGVQVFFSAVVLGNAVGSTLTSTGLGGSSSDEAIVFLGTVDALESGKQTLTVDAAGLVIFAGNIGSTAKLGELTVTASDGIFIGGPNPITIDTLALSVSSVTTTGNQTYNGGVVLSQDATLTSNIGGDITFASTIDALELGTQTLTVNAFDDAIFDGDIGAGTFALGELTVTAGGTIQLNSAIVNTASDNVAGTSGAQLFNSAVVLGNAVGSTLTSTGGGNLTFGAGITGLYNLDLDAGTTGAITGTSVAINNLTITNGASATFTGAVTVNDFITKSSTVINISMTGTGNTFVEQVMFLNGGVVTLGNGGDTFEFRSGMSMNGVGLTTSLAANITSGGIIDFGPGLITLTNNSTVATTFSAGTGQNIIFSNGSGMTGQYDLGLDAGTGGAITGSTVSIRNLTITNGASAAFYDVVTLNDFITTLGTSTTISMTRTGSSFVENVNFLNSGLVTLGGSSIRTLTFNGGLNFEGNAASNIAGNIYSSGDAIDFGTGGVTLASNSVVRTTMSGVATGADITFGGTLTGGYNLDLLAGTNGAIRGTSVAINNLTISTGASAAFTDAVTVNDLITRSGSYTLSMTGTGNTFAASVEFINTGLVTLGDATADTFEFGGGMSFAGGAASNVAATITSGGVVNFGAGGVTLLDHSSVATTMGPAAGEAITFGGTLNGTFNLGLTAGTSDITFGDAVGSGLGTALSAITITSARNVTAVAITASSFTQDLGTGTTTFNGAQNYNTAAGLNVVTDGIIALNSSVTTTSNGIVTLDSAATLLIADGADISAAGAVNLTADGGITTSGGVTTTGAVVNYNSATTLTGDILVSTGAGADINFASTLNGNHNLGLTAGTSDITFGDAVGSGPGTALGAITITSARNVTAAAITASSFTDTSGTGNATFNGAQNYNTAAGLNVVTGGIIALNSSVTTTSNGIVTLNGVSGVVVAGNITAGGTGAINITGNTNVTLALRSDVGVTVNGGVTIQSTNGNLIITGTGGEDIGGNNYGVYNAGTITSSGSGNVTVTGNGGNGADGENYGVLNEGVDSANKALITSGGGNVVVTGTGGTSTNATSDGVSNDGIYMINGTITSGLAGSVTVTGIGGESVPGRNHGIRNKGTITSGGMGEVIVSGTGGTSTGDVVGVPNSNYGIINKDGAEIKSGGGAVTVIGVGGNGADGMNYGIQNMTLATITSGGTGSVTVTGTGGSGSGGLGKDNYGVYNFGSSITSGGNLTITGNGGNGVGGYNNGVYSINDGNANGAITAGGNVVITGTGGDGADGFNAGVYTRHTEFMSSGSMAINGEGGTGGFNVAIVLVDGPIHVGGNFSATTSVNAGSSNSKILIETPITTTNGGAVDINARVGSLSIEDTGVINSDGVVTLTADGGISTAGDVNTSGAVVNYNSATTLTGDILVSTGAGADINFASTLNGTFNLGLTAGTSDITFGDAVGSGPGTALGAITITSARNVTAVAITASSFTDTSGTGNATFNGAQNYNTAAGLNVVTDGIIALNSSVTTTSNGIVTLDSAATLLIADGADISAAGAVNLTADGGITTSGGVTTTGAVVNYNSATTLLDGIRLDTTGAGTSAGASITFVSTVDGVAGSPRVLRLTAGTGDITFTDAVGSFASLGAITVVSANNVTAAAITASSFTDTSGTGNATFNGAQNYNTAAGLNVVTGGIITLNSSVTTTSNGIVTLNGVSGVVVAGNITAGGTGAINITGNTNVTPALRSTVGVTVNNGVTIQSTNGNLIITGTGGEDIGGNNYGVYNAGTITSSGSGNVTVTGNGGSGGRVNMGILNRNGTISSGGGAVAVTGTGGSGNGAAYGLQNVGTITSGDGGNVTVIGTGGSGDGGHNSGVIIGYYGRITSGVGGNVTVIGTGGSGNGGSNDGILNYDGTITSGGGNVELTGIGGTGIGGFNIGVLNQAAATITSGGTGSVTVTGTGGSGGSNNDAIFIADFITAPGALILISNGGAINQTLGTITVVGTTTITAGANDVTLAQSTNDFGGAVSVVSADNVSLRDANALTLGASNISGNLAVTAAGAINQTTDAILVGGATTLTASAADTDIDLASGENNFAGTVTIDGDASFVRDFMLRNVNATPGVIANLSSASNLRDFTIIYANAFYGLPSLPSSSLRNVNIVAAGISTIGGTTLTTHNDGTVTLNSTRDLAIAPGANIVADGAVELTGTDGIFIAGNVTTTGDSVTFNSETTMTDGYSVNIDTTNGSLPEGADIFFGAAVKVGINNSQALNLNAGTNGDITLTGDVGSPTFMLSNLTLVAADTIIIGNIYVAGNTTAGNITIINDTIIESNGSLTVGSIDGGGYAVTISTVDLVLTAPITDVTTFTIQNSDPNGAITLMGLGGLSIDQNDWNFIDAGVNVVLGGANYTGTVTVNGAWTNDRSVTVAFEPGSAGHININSPITGTGSLTINGSGNTTTLAADIVQNSIHITDAVEVNAALVTLIATAGDVVINGAIIGLFGGESLTVTASANVSLLGTIGGTTAATQLGTLTVNSGNGSRNTITFGNLASTVRAETVNLNTGASSTLAAPATRATIVSDGNIEFVTDQFAMGQNHKLTSFGDVVIGGLTGVNAATVSLGDVNAVGDLRVNANSITLLGRNSGLIFTSSGGLMNDVRLDYVVGGRVYFSDAPIMGGTNPGNRAAFANPTGDVDALGTLGAYSTSEYPTAVTSALLSGAGGATLDLSASNSVILFLSNPAKSIPQAMSSMPPIGLLGDADTLDDEDDEDGAAVPVADDQATEPISTPTQTEKTATDVPVNAIGAAVPVALR